MSNKGDKSTEPKPITELPEDKGLEESWVIDTLAPDPYVVLGHKLTPLSMGHLILFRKAGLWWLDREPNSFTLEDLALGVLICSRNFKDGFALLDNPGLKAAMTTWGREVGGNRWRDVILRRNGRNVGAATILFVDYLREGIKRPEVHVHQEGTISVSLPELQAVRVFLLQETSLRDTEILDRSWRLSVLDYLTAKAMEGQVQFVSGDVYSAAYEMAKDLHSRREAAAKTEKKTTGDMKGFSNADSQS